ncbi:hypothetical protein PDG61_17995 [Mycolicibacterium sp. BiH015]|uniref:hypothetical protein n=1 Tax=Mycolicibacterium sp. BiH015 TaxID=3018808 RepID=UPI0022E6FF78|nr:hypothetical protein [Mycolicibacterium sp. BiH015]MDA2892818.1 hypothetical protein [Mycolicibacterium sp. BiH015]
MGGRLARLAARQHPDLTASATPASGRLRVVLLALLAVDGVLSALMAVFFLPLRIGSIPFPISALLSGILNAALVWAAFQWTSVPRLAALPLWAWLATILMFTVVTPGEDIVFGGSGVMEFGPVLLVALGALPAAWIVVHPPSR